MIFNLPKEPFLYDPKEADALLGPGLQKKFQPKGNSSGMPKPTSMKEIESKNKNKKGKKDEPVEKKDVETEDKEMTNEIIEMI